MNEWNGWLDKTKILAFVKKITGEAVMVDRQNEVNMLVTSNKMVWYDRQGEQVGKNNDKKCCWIKL